MGDEFLTTHWSLVLAAGGSGPEASDSLEKLCHSVWRPLYAYARRWGCSPEDAEDAVQGFIASLLSRQSLAKAEPSRGKFRSFLLAGMRNHMSDMASRASAAKRGGGARHLSLDTENAEHGFTAVALEADSPEKAFDRMWAMDVMTRTKRRLAEECAAGGKAAVFAALFPESVGGAEASAANDFGSAASYATLSTQLGLSEPSLRSLAMRLRRRWRDLILADLAQGVTSREALDEEMICLRAALSG